MFSNVVVMILHLLSLQPLAKKRKIDENIVDFAGESSPLRLATTRCI